MDLSTDGGTSFTDDIIPAISDDRDEWQNKLVDLSAYAGESNVVLRFRGVTGSSFLSDIALDDISLFNDVDTNSDGIRDGDGVDNSSDYDPSGYFYDEATGEIVAGGSIAVSCDIGTPAFVAGLDGSNGEYQFIVSGVGAPSTCSITPSIPPGYTLSASCADAGKLDVDPRPGVQALGSGENANSGQLVDASCVANPFYLTLSVNPGDAFVLNNNLPLARIPSTPTDPTAAADAKLVPISLLGLPLGIVGLLFSGIWFIRKRRG